MKLTMHVNEERESSTLISIEDREAEICHLRHSHRIEFYLKKRAGSAFLMKERAK